jgi:hypothetical protein
LNDCWLARQVSHGHGLKDFLPNTSRHIRLAPAAKDIEKANEPDLYHRERSRSRSQDDHHHETKGHHQSCEFLHVHRSLRAPAFLWHATHAGLLLCIAWFAPGF